MAPQITVLEHAFNFSLPDVPNDTVSRLSKLTFDGEVNTHFFLVKHLGISSLQYSSDRSITLKKKKFGKFFTII